MPRWRKVNVKKLSPQKQPEYYRRHRACPWMLEWREPGGKHSKRRFVADRETATLLARKLEDRINVGHHDIIPRRIKLQHAKDLFLERPGLKAETQRLYGGSLKRYGQLCDWPNSYQWTVASVEMFMCKRLAKGASKSTVNKDLRTLSAFFAWAVSRNYCDVDPIQQMPRGSRRLKTTKPVRVIWTPDQFKQILEYCNPEWRLMALLYITGVGRLTALRQLTLNSIDFEHELILVRADKGDKQRLAPIHPTLMAELLKYTSDLPAGQKALFTCKFHASTWRRLCEKAALPRLPLHHLRSCLATWLVERGVPEDDIRRVLDHSNTEVTRAHYLHPQEAKLRRAAIQQLPL